MPIKIPAGVEVGIAGTSVTVKGPRGKLARELHPSIRAVVENDQIVVRRSGDDELHRSLHGLTRSILANMVTGVTEGFGKTLELSGVGYRAARQGNKLVLMLGYSRPVEFEVPQGLTVEVPNPTTVVVKGIDKEAVGQFSALIRSSRDPDPYKAKGVKYAGEFIRRKAGKAGKK